MNYIKTYEEYRDPISDTIISLFSRKRFFGKNYDLILRNAVYKLAKKVFKNRPDIQIKNSGVNSDDLNGVYLILYHNRTKDKEGIYIDYESDDNLKYTNIVTLACTVHKFDDDINNFTKFLNDVVSTYSNYNLPMSTPGIVWHQIQEKDVKKIIPFLTLENYEMEMDIKKYNL